MWQWRWPGPEVRVRVSTYGLMTVASLVIVAVLFGDPDRSVGGFLNKWQTLIAGGLAIIAAWISLSGPRAQIAQAGRLARQAAEREEAGARALLPMALSYISDYARSCADLSANLFEAHRDAGNPIVLPTFDRSNLTLVRDALRHAPPLYRDRMYALLNAVQVSASAPLTPGSRPRTRDMGGSGRGRVRRKGRTCHDDEL